ncbi:tafazzin [Pyrus ussuriensis x Pyrus communis]|uniref:Tafazzin family protein n=1 Tax=Pyrus ussuriensis x Pyrus communis TaxID=2448454 RepID=A0A5N5HED5_9ROSA|nr:tafazzin [Pyrus ussuriensis x Pyrus communis]
MAAARVERGDLWKSKALSVQLRLRQRFRVEVDRRLRHHPIFSNDGYFSSTLQRWLERFRDFRRDSLPSSTAFYRKRVGKEFNAEEESILLRMLQAVAVPVIGSVCHVFMNGLNQVQVYGVEKLHDAVLRRPKGKPLITVSNHVASMDDPLVLSALLPRHVLLDAQNLRWTLCASDRCFANPVTSAFFRSVKVLPVSRGDGIYQKGMDAAISKLNQGGWVHIFPEGSRSRDGGKTMGSSKRGVGRLVLDADNIPMVVPFVHSGMQDIMPIGASIPRIGNTVTVVIGDPIYFDDLLNSEGAKHVSRGKLYDAVSSRIGHRLSELKVQVDKLAQVTRSQNLPAQNTDRAAVILQHVDWELFGMGNLTPSEDDGSPLQETEIQLAAPPHTQEPRPADWSYRVGFSREGGFASRMRSFMDQSEFMGFAARGIFMNRRVQETSPSGSGVGPLKAWRRYLEANVLPQWN